MDQPMRQERDLVLPPNTFAFVLDRTKGRVSSYVGPYRSSLSDTDVLVVYREGKFIQEREIERAIQTFVEAQEGQYVVLSNPSRGEEPEVAPRAATTNDTIDLSTGRKIVIPGPTTFPLWPGQEAQVINGHHLRHNQYLVVRVYEPQAAQENAERALVAPQRTEEGGEDSTRALHRDFTMGQQIVIRGSDVSFYMPPTGIEVIPETPGNFVRDAATLEQLEYCVLLDESGRKRFEKGPAVVFPEPTETFATDNEGNRKFRAIELNAQSGLYIKVIASYEDETGSHAEGEELFLTGERTPIYFPRVEHSIIQYGDQRKHHAIAVPEGEGRYVLDRFQGRVNLVKGPKMFLPDPRREVVVRRILDPSIVQVMYPGNDEALHVNEEYRAEQEERLRQSKQIRGGVQTFTEDYLEAGAPMMRSAMLSQTGAPAATPSTTFGGEKMRRGTEYTPPRMITLDTKYEGAVTVSVWPGYAVLVMDKSGNRRVEVGPINILLAYDESLMLLSLSTGRPKSDRNKLRTPYLRTVNNSVSDRVTVETRDLVPVTLDLSLRVNFEGENETKWFDVEDYVALLTDHCRSKLRNIAKRHDIQEFYTQTIDLIRDGLLGTPEDGTARPGMSFEENNMRLYDIEVLDVHIEHDSVERLLTGAMDEALKGAIRLSQVQQETERERQMEELRRERMAEQEATRETEHDMALAGVGRDRTISVRRIEVEHDLNTAQVEVSAIRRSEARAAADQELAIMRQRDEAELAHLTASVAVMIDRAKAIDPQLVHAISQMGDQQFVERLVEAVGPVALATGVTAVDMFQQIFENTPFEGITKALAERPFAHVNGGDASGTLSDD